MGLMVYIIGGDGTQRGAVKIHKECVRRGLKVAVAGIPKTVDNDVAIIDKSFGFDTAVEAAQDAISAAHVEVTSTPKAVGVVKVMGRYAGHIAVAATLGSRDVDCCLIPEIPFFIDGEGGLFQFLEARLRENDHCVILVAEGAGQDLMRETFGNKENTDQSGNKSLLDVGLWLSSQLKEKWRKEKGESLSLKYIELVLSYLNCTSPQKRPDSGVEATNNQPEFSRRSHATKGVPSSEPKKGGQGKAK
ncbi:hypothetical protein CBR_g39504 [Chara braunii]|uniref:Phosphofructokinase domain-containing protein n=1 Tax=Chara braunii TaxID=69332 RepID=A0A388LRS6_CHABU|nr:hypothetical protein CBR_g39504 [Chara braunii]|eukprot:GBG85040.1 hypothetical protein CBR_g39504 [Chara braunii]